MVHKNQCLFSPVGKNSQNTAQGRRIAVALRREKFVFRAKIRRIREKLFANLRISVAPRKIHKNFFCKFFVFWAKIRSQSEKFTKIRKCDGITCAVFSTSDPRRKCVALRRIRNNLQVRRRCAVAGENVSQIQRNYDANAKIKTEYDAFWSHLRKIPKNSQVKSLQNWRILVAM